MRRSIFSRLINKVLMALLIVQAGCDDPSSSPAQFKDSPETEQDSLIPPLFTKTKIQGVSIAVIRKRPVQFVEGYGFADKSVMAFQVDFPELFNQLK